MNKEIEESFKGLVVELYRLSEIFYSKLRESGVKEQKAREFQGRFIKEFFRVV